MISFTVKHTRDTTRGLTTMHRRQMRALGRLTKDVAMDAKRRAARLAPVGKAVRRKRKGKRRAGTHNRQFGGGGLKGSIKASGPHHKRSTVYSVVGVAEKLHYAPYQEFGTGKRGRAFAAAKGHRWGWDVSALGYSTTWPGMPPGGRKRRRPFLSEGVRQAGARMVQRAGEVLKRVWLGR